MAIAVHGSRVNGDRAIRVIGEPLTDGVDHLRWGDWVGLTEVKPQRRGETIKLIEHTFYSRPVPGDRSGEVTGRGAGKGKGAAETYAEANHSAVGSLPYPLRYRLNILAAHRPVELTNALERLIPTT